MGDFSADPLGCLVRSVLEMPAFLVFPAAASVEGSEESALVYPVLVFSLGERSSGAPHGI